ncbi:MAG: N-acetyl-alpha-D-glucosaminyl L-malate synthase BshA [Bacteroidetes bacterium]|nr:N-acetyl-alpha-D-glucosaminyl L-malate synthase BshA [Bacteroidota bacterium]
MNIGIVCYPTYGGSGIVATELGMELANRGHKIHFISYALPKRLYQVTSNIFFHEVEISNYPLFEFPLYTPSLASKIIEVAETHNLDIVHAHYAIPHATSAYLAKQIVKNKNLKIITTLHGTDITLVGVEPYFLPVVKFSIENSDGVTAVSKFLKDKTIENFNINKEIEVIPNFVDTNKYFRKNNPELRKTIAPLKNKIVVHISNFRAVKRIQDVITIFKNINSKIPSTLILVGDGPDKLIAKELINKLNLEKDVILLGKQSDLTDILSMADLFLLPSQIESFGLAALEAMSCGVPVIASNSGGISEVVLHNITGFTANVGDIENFTKYSLQILENESLHQKFILAAQEQAKHFEMDKIIKHYEDYYLKIVNSN